MSYIILSLMLLFVFTILSFYSYPRANGAKRRSGRKPGARVLIPPGYFSTLGKSMGSLKFIKFCGRIAIVDGVMGGPPTDLNKVDRRRCSEH